MIFLQSFSLCLPCTFLPPTTYRNITQDLPCYTTMLSFSDYEGCTSECSISTAPSTIFWRLSSSPPSLLTWWGTLKQWLWTFRVFNDNKQLLRHVCHRFPTTVLKARIYQPIRCLIWNRIQKEFKHLLICWAKTELLCQLYSHEKNGTMKICFNQTGPISIEWKRV